MVWWLATLNVIIPKSLWEPVKYFTITGY